MIFSELLLVFLIGNCEKPKSFLNFLASKDLKFLKNFFIRNGIKMAHTLTIPLNMLISSQDFGNRKIKVRRLTKRYYEDLIE